LLSETRSKCFANGVVYALQTEDGYPVETTDTFLPFSTKFCTNGNNKAQPNDLGSRQERWMIGVSIASGCPVGCLFCATGQLPRYRPLTAAEIVEQVEFIINKNTTDPTTAKEFKINYTRMGEIGMNPFAVREAIAIISERYPNTHHYVSTIGIRGMDFSWIKGNITLQLSLHSLDESRRRALIPVNNVMSIPELGQIRTQSNLKTTINLTLVDDADWDINELKKHFDPEHFFIKISPINKNIVSEMNAMGSGVISSV
jgi:adenine C2-methylase RlmN of 23S rRNA A2503 and tRNA A37